MKPVGPILPRMATIIKTEVKAHNNNTARTGVLARSLVDGAPA
jgi:hypothetical protein